MSERRFVFVFICFLFEAITLSIKEEPELAEDEMPKNDSALGGADLIMRS